MKGKQNAYSLQQNKKFVLDKGYSLTIECILVEQKRMNLYDIIASKVCAYLRDRGYIPINKYNRTVVYEKVE